MSSHKDLFRDIDEQYEVRKNSHSKSTQTLLREALAEHIVLSTIDNTNAVHQWGSSVESEKFPFGNGGQFSIHTNFEGLNILKSIAYDVGGDALDSYERVKSDLMMAHSVYPGEKAKGHGPHCRKNSFTQADCVAQGHHEGWWHSNQAALFVTEGFRDYEHLKDLEHSCFSGKDGTCPECKANDLVDEMVAEREARHDVRPEIGERRHALHHQRLCTTHHSVSLSHVDGEKDVLIHVREVIPYKEVGADTNRTKDQERIDREWRSSDSMVEESEDKYTTIPEQKRGRWYKKHPWVAKYEVTDKKPAHFVSTGPYYGMSSKWERRTRLGHVVGFVNSTFTIKKTMVPCPCETCLANRGLVGTYIRKANKTMLVDTGRQVTIPEQPRMRAPKPMMFVDKVLAQYVDKVAQKERYKTLEKGLEMETKAILAGADEATILKIRQGIEILSRPKLTTPREYTWSRDAGGWARDDGDVLTKYQFNAIREACRGVVKQFSDWGGSWGWYDDVSMPASPLHTQTALELGLIGPGSKNPNIMELPEPVVIRTVEKMKDGKVHERYLHKGDNYPLGKLPFRTYHCFVCRKDTPHMRDTWQAGRYQGMFQFNGAIYGKSGHIKCILCGSVLMRKALKVKITTKLERTDDVIWSMVGYIYGEGYFAEWLNYHRRENTHIWKTLSLAAKVEAIIRSNPAIKVNFQEKLESSGGDATMAY